MMKEYAKLIPHEAEPLLLELLGRIERARGLVDEESELLEVFVRRQCRREGSARKVWTPADDKRLLKIAKTTTRQNGRIRKLALEMGVSPSAAHSRLRNLRKRQREKGGV